MRRLTSPIRPTENVIRITIEVAPNAKQTRILLERDGSITMRVHAPPAKGKANREIVKWLSKKLGMPSSRIRTIAGLLSDLKTIEIIGVDETGFLGAVRQEPAIGL
jgi:hypothetical protein